MASKEALEALASEAMDTLKMKIGLLTKESKESTDKMAEAAKVGVHQYPSCHAATLRYRIMDKHLKGIRFLEMWYFCKIELRETN